MAYAATVVSVGMQDIPKMASSSWKDTLTKVLQHPVVSVPVELSLIGGWATMKGVAKVTLATGHYCESKSSTWSAAQLKMTAARKGRKA